MSNGSKITLENFNYQKKGPRLSSPYSIKACKILGVDEKDLIKLSFNEYLQLHIESKKLPKDIQQQRYDFYEKDRQTLIKDLKETRKELKENDENEKQNKKNENENNENNENNEKNENNNDQNEESSLLRRTKSLNATKFIETIQDKETKKKYEKMLEKFEQSMQKQVDKEFEQEEKRRENFEKIMKNIEKDKIEKEKKDKELQEKKNQREKKENECKQKSLKLQEKKEELLILKQKEIDNRIENQISLNNQKRLEKSQKINQRYELKKEQMYRLLTESDSKLQEKLKIFNETKKQKEERYNQRMQEKLNEYHKKNEENQKKILNAKVLQEQKLNANKEKLNNYREKVDQRIKLYKDEQEKQRMLKFNKLYLSESSQRLRHQRNENAKEYMRDLQFEKIQEKMRRIEQIQETRRKILSDKKRLETELMIDKAKMNERLHSMLRSNKNFTKEQLYEFVLTGKKPQNLKSETNSQFLSPNKNASKSVDGINVDAIDTDNVFITSSP